MSFTCSWRAALIALVAFCAACDPNARRAAEPAPENDARFAVTYSPHMRGFDCYMNMGPTGAEAWMRGYQFVVTSIQQDSPAWEKLELGDVVVGVNGKMFSASSDHRMDLGNAIETSQAAGQPLRLHVLRKLNPLVVDIALPRLGSFSPTWPMNCDKSKALLTRACEALLDAQTPSGGVMSDQMFGSYCAGLLWLASDDPNYLDAARRCVYQTITRDEPFNLGLANWARGYGSILLAEYYLSTGDDTVLPKLREVVKQIEVGQMECGSWGHNGPAGGYGALNQAGLPSAIALVLAKECGVNVDEKVLGKALTFFRRYAGIGAVPYGDHHPYGALDDNGKNSQAAVLFHLNDENEPARLFGESAGDSFWLREQGHTGPYLSMMWGPMGVSLGAPEKLRGFLDYQNWYYNLIAKWDGSMTILPYQEALTRFDSSSYIHDGNRFATGGLAMVYTLPMKKLRITGAPHSVFGVKAKLTGKLKEARDLYVARKWREFDAAVAAIHPATLKSDEEVTWLKQLTTARAFAGKSIDRLSVEILNNLREGAPYTALQQFNALKKAYGEDGDPRIAELEKKVMEPGIQWLMTGAKRYSDAIDAIESFSSQTWYPEGENLYQKLEGTPSIRQALWEPVSAVSETTPQPWKSKLYAKDQPFEEGLEQPDFDDSAWTAHEGIFTRLDAEKAKSPANGPIAARRSFDIANLNDLRGSEFRVRVRTVREVRTKVYLNGQLIADLERGQRGGYASIAMKEDFIDLLKEGRNVLAVTSASQGGANNKLDAGIEFNRRGISPGHRPIHRIATLDSRYLPHDVDTSLLVARTCNNYRAALEQSYKNKSVAELVGQMDNQTAYYRELTAAGLAGKGEEGYIAAVARMDDPSWRVRATAVTVILTAQAQFKKDKNDAGLASLVKYMPALEKRVADEHMWVRVRACDTLKGFGVDATPALKSLTAATLDPAEWVRQAALSAILATGTDPNAMLEAVRQAASKPNTAGTIASLAVKTATSAKDTQAQKSLTVLVEVIKNPPDLGGGVVTSAIELACELDPRGEVMIPILTHAVADKNAFGNSGGNPRGTAIEALGKYGPKAAAALPALKAVLADTTEKEKKLHDPAKAAIAAIQGH